MRKSLSQSMRMSRPNKRKQGSNERLQTTGESEVFEQSPASTQIVQIRKSHSTVRTLKSKDVLQMAKKKSTSGSILKPENREFRNQIIEDEFKDEFDRLFSDGVEQAKDENQQKALISKQVVFVNGKQYEFSQFDSIFKLVKSNLPMELLGNKGSTMLSNLEPLVNKGCFCCSKLLTRRVKQDICHFCTQQGCKECIYKRFPFPKKDKSGQQLRGRICRICEAKLYIKMNLDVIFTNIEKKEMIEERLETDMSILQKKKADLRLQKDQVNIQKRNYQQEHNQKVDKGQSLVQSKKERIQRIEKDNARIAQLITKRNQEYLALQQQTRRLNDQINEAQQDVEATERKLEDVTRDKQKVLSLKFQYENFLKNQKSQPNVSASNNSLFGSHLTHASIASPHKKSIRSTKKLQSSINKKDEDKKICKDCSIY